MFLGEYTHTLDTKGRIFIPAKYREELGEQFVITKGTAKCLSVYPMAYWNTLVAKVESLPITQTAKFRRFWLAQASVVESDTQGRVLLASGYREYAEILKNAVVIGVGSYLEIWSEEEWTKTKDEMDADEINDIMISLGF